MIADNLGLIELLLVCGAALLLAIRELIVTRPKSDKGRKEKPGSSGRIRRRDG